MSILDRLLGRGYNRDKHFSTPVGKCKFCGQPVFPGSYGACGDEHWHPACDPKNWEPLTEEDKTDTEVRIAQMKQEGWMPGAYFSDERPPFNNPNFRQAEKHFRKRMEEEWVRDLDWNLRAWERIAEDPTRAPGWMGQNLEAIRNRANERVAGLRRKKEQNE